ncbi:hypothetical protein EU538_00225 [Candidatus Thorarchaeota archaeon]|nr:MAG: hypothetical protein EU538_00225 [Candidatus Thorarchaeota archaeon]
MRTYMIVFDSLPIEKSRIRVGRNPQSLVTACRCVNIALFVSGNLRRDVQIVLSQCEDDGVSFITFPGDRLKRVSPDERSISFFIMKAADHLERIASGEEATMNNGIRVEKCTPDEMLDSLSKSQVYLADPSSEIMPRQIRLKPESIFLYPVDSPLGINPSDFSFDLLWKPEHPERFINDLNRAFDYS